MSTSDLKAFDSKSTTTGDKKINNFLKSLKTGVQTGVDAAKKVGEKKNHCDKFQLLITNVN